MLYLRNPYINVRLFYIFYLILPTILFAQVDTAWVRRYNGPGENWDQPFALAVDNAGNVYVTGGSVGLATRSDYLTIKYNTAGVEQWVERYNGPANGWDYALALAVDNAGNVYVTGGSWGSGTSYDYVTIKYNTAGVEQWVERYNGLGNWYDDAFAVAVDNTGNVYVTGRSWGSGTSYDYVTIKYNTAGVEQWVERYNGPANGWDEATALAVDNAGNVYVTGKSWNSGTDYDYVTIKYNAVGDTQWVKRYNGPGDSLDETFSLAVDNAGNVYVTGRSWGSGTSYDYATIKYDAAGNTQWVKRYNGPDNDWDEAYALAVDQDGNVYVTGHSAGFYTTIKYNALGVEQWVQRYNAPGGGWNVAYALAVDQDGNVYVTGYSVEYDIDYATIKYNSSGVEQWVQRYDGPTGLGDDYATEIAIDQAGNVYVTGYSCNEVGIDADYATIKYVQSPAVIEEHTTLDYKHISLDAKPNPFKTQTNIWYSLLTEGKVRLSIYDVSGRQVRTLENEFKQPGTYFVNWNGTDDNGQTVSQGVYFYVLEVNEKKFQNKMVKLR